MFSLGASNSYYLCVGGCDLRKGFDALSGVVQSQMGREVLSGEVFIFINNSRNSMKLLHWESGGLVIYHKRLEQGRFSLPRLDPQTGSYRLTWTDLVLMVDGISVDKIRYKKRLKEAPKQ
jgi:transposase